MLRASDIRRVVLVWLGLMLLTAVSWWSGTGHGPGDGSHDPATVVVLVVAFLKVRLVGLNFMELRHAALPLRLCFEAWVVVVPVALIGMYLVP